MIKTIRVLRFRTILQNELSFRDEGNVACFVANNFVENIYDVYSFFFFF